MITKKVILCILSAILGGILLLSFIRFIDISNNKEIIISFRYFFLPFIIGGFIGILITIISLKNKELKETNKKLKYLSSTDCLTKTLNRKTGLEILEKELNKTKRHKKNLIIAFIDINKLKIVNDKYGHHEGDEYIIQINKIIKKTLRNTEYIIRIGGDEFLIIFDNKNTEKQVEDIIRRITTKVNNYNKRKIKPYNMGFCYGIATHNYKETINISEFLKKADEKMYKQKKKLYKK
ncbi:MAG: GGDEF domain-containing protein [Candidatus Woesearchaeota archaeon]|jgi:diguanylate cyclase (GGDEF)-like protein|nr:GGDEF domain-containing protein [Candidatus Woesearchaeota archaeon]